jgi:heptosyltransferase-1
MKILIIKPSSLGDIIHALPFLKAVKDTFPESRVDWVISKNLKGIIEEHPLIDNLIIFDKDSWKSVKRLPETLSEISKLRQSLKSRHYDIVVDLQGLLRSGLIATSTRTTLKIGFADAREGSKYLYDKRVTVNGGLHAVDRYLEIAKAIGARVKKIEFPLYVDKTAKEKIKALIGNINEYIVIVPSARWITKRWPAENFALLIKNISIPCVITGSKSEKMLTQKILNSASDNIINLCGKTDLKELTALIAGAKAVVSNDSGPMHIAVALGVPTVTIFGPTDPVKTGPYGWQTNRNFRVIRANVSCSPCRKKRCKELICMHNVGVDVVYKALKEIKVI